MFFFEIGVTFSNLNDNDMPVAVSTNDFAEQIEEILGSLQAKSSRGRCKSWMNHQRRGSPRRNKPEWRINQQGGAPDVQSTVSRPRNKPHQVTTASCIHGSADKHATGRGRRGRISANAPPRNKKSPSNQYAWAQTM